jgi:hypothetical protein
LLTEVEFVLLPPEILTFDPLIFECRVCKEKVGEEDLETHAKTRHQATQMVVDIRPAMKGVVIT